jgi:aryl-alcohol dehydrogenase-like predicted oxidoreductase
MQRRSLGSSGFGISRIGLGTWAVGGHMWGGQDDTQSIDAIHAAVDHGVTWIDTAPIYGSGHSETVVGQAVRQLPPSKRPMIFTKFGLGIDSNAPDRSAAAADVSAECEASLRRLSVDHIDLYQLHWPAPQPVAETAAACDALLKAGKIRAIGVSNFSVAQLEEWRATGVPLHCDQPPFSILRPAVKHDVLPWCAAHNVGVISYSPLFRGMLFGTWPKDKTFPTDDGRSTHKDYSGVRFQRHLQAVDEIRAVAASGGLSVAQLCIGVLLQTPGLTAVIAGARSGHQGGLIANLGASVTADQAGVVWAIAEKLAKDLESM